MSELGKYIRYLVEQGYLDVEAARRVEARADHDCERLGQLMLRRRYVTTRQMLDLVRQRYTEVEMPIGELAVRAGYLDRDQLDDLLRMQLAARRHIAELVITEGHLDAVSALEVMEMYVQWLDATALDDGETTIDESPAAA